MLVWDEILPPCPPRPAISIKLVWLCALCGCSSSGPVLIIPGSLLTRADSLPTAFQLPEPVKSSCKYLISFNVFHHALGYTQCSLSLHVLEACDYKYYLVWVFRMMDCWEFFNEIILQKKKSSQTGSATLNPKIVPGKVIAQGIGEWDTSVGGK